jgi:methylated-DNA-[protein]-cysteine S-methyltransferase
MADQNYTLFETAIGTCGIVWTARGVCGMQLPEKDATATRARVERRYPDAREAPPPSAIQNAIDGIIALLSGERRDLLHIVIDDAAISDFNRKVYAIARAIPPGQTLTYGEIAERLGDKTLARAVGQAMGENPTPVIMPCHRVLAAGGKTGGFSAPGGIVTKLQLLTIEGAQPGGPTLFAHLPLQVAARRRG